MGDRVKSERTGGGVSRPSSAERGRRQATRAPSPLLILLGCVALAATLTWVLPAGEFERRNDPVTGRNVVVPGTYARVAPAPVSPFAAVVAIPRGLVEAADVVAVILFVGGAWVVLDQLGTLGRLVGLFVAAIGHRRQLAIPIVALFFSAMGALENMQEEIIPLVPVLLLLGRRLGVDAVTAIGMSAGAAMVGSAFGPTNPFQAGIAMKLADLPPLTAAVGRTLLWVAATTLWVLWTMRRANRPTPAAPLAPSAPVAPPAPPAPSAPPAPVAPSAPSAPLLRDFVSLSCLLFPMAAYVYGALAWDWGFNELSAGFLIGGIAAGLAGGLGLGRTLDVFLEGMKGLVSSAVLVGVARSISLVLADGRVIDTILVALAEPLAGAPQAFAALLMVPFHVLVHIPVSSVSGQAVLTMPLLVPLSDLIGVSRVATVLAYQIGAGLTELLTPTNGSMMAIITAAGISYAQWARFAGVGVALVAAAGVIGLLLLG